jgi:cytochrome c peroxidase
MRGIASGALRLWRGVIQQLASGPARSLLCRAAYAICLAGLGTGQALAQLAPVPVPPENPQTTAKINLGKALFWEEQLSLTGTVACGTCHRPSAGGSDPRTALGVATSHPGPDGIFGNADDSFASAGVPLHDAGGHYQPSLYFGINPQVSRRKAPSPLMAAFMPLLFWDGRAGFGFSDPLDGQPLVPAGAALESLSLQPLLDATEMGHAGNTAAGLPARLQGITPLALAFAIPDGLREWIAGRTYPALFADAFGSAEITPARMAFALASYQRALNDTRTPLDQELSGIPTLTPEQRQGQALFSIIGCDQCHAGALHANATGTGFVNIGVRPQDDDLGRFLVTGASRDRGVFKVPSLRNVALRAPYMHNGRFPTLDAVFEFYRRGGDFDAPNKDPRIRPLGIGLQQKAALLAYLEGALTDPRIRAEQPPYDRPRLYSESPHVPAIIDSGVAGSHGVPLISALEPPLAGNRKFTVAVSQALAGAPATLVVSHADPGVQSAVPAGDYATIATLIQSGNGYSHGYASVQLDLAQTPGLAGQTLYGRYYIADAQAANGLAVSAAFRITVFDAGDILLRNGFD